MPNDLPSDEIYKAIIENLADGVYYVDPNRRIEYWNQGAGDWATDQPRSSDTGVSRTSSITLTPRVISSATQPVRSRPRSPTVRLERPRCGFATATDIASPSGSGPCPFAMHPGPSSAE